MAASIDGAARQRTTNGLQADEENVIQSELVSDADAKQTSTRRAYTIDGLPFWDRFRGVGRRQVGIVESLKAIALSSCALTGGDLPPTRSQLKGALV